MAIRYIFSHSSGVTVTFGLAGRSYRRDKPRKDRADLVLDKNSFAAPLLSASRASSTESWELCPLNPTVKNRKNGEIVPAQRVMIWVTRSLGWSRIFT